MSKDAEAETGPDQSGPKARKLATHWWRIGAAALGGVISGVIAWGRVHPTGAAILIAWNVAAAIHLAGLGRLVLASDEAKVRARAAEEDENRAVLMSLILLAVAASLGAIVVTLHDVQTGGKGAIPPWVVALSGLTLVQSWLVVQGLFALHYAHRYFGDRDRDGAEDGGIEFPGEPPRGYMDFVYVAVCIGATCQVSDFDITKSRFRNLIAVHALIAFAFNTTILALGINMIGNLMGGG